MDEQQNSDQHSTPLRISRNLRDRSSRINYANLTVPDKRARRSRSPSPARRNLLTVNISPVSTPNIPERITEESRSYDSNNNQKNGDTHTAIHRNSSRKITRKSSTKSWTPFSTNMTKAKVRRVMGIKYSPTNKVALIDAIRRPLWGERDLSSSLLSEQSDTDVSSCNVPSLNLTSFLNPFRTRNNPIETSPSKNSSEMSSSSNTSNSSNTSSNASEFSDDDSDYGDSPEKIPNFLAHVLKPNISSFQSTAETINNYLEKNCNSFAIVLTKTFTSMITSIIALIISFFTNIFSFHKTFTKSFTKSLKQALPKALPLIIALFITCIIVTIAPVLYTLSTQFVRYLFFEKLPETALFIQNTAISLVLVPYACVCSISSNFQENYERISDNTKSLLNQSRHSFDENVQNLNQNLNQNYGSMQEKYDDIQKNLQESLRENYGRMQEKYEKVKQIGFPTAGILGQVDTTPKTPDFEKTELQKILERLDGIENKIHKIQSENDKPNPDEQIESLNVLIQGLQHEISRIETENPKSPLENKISEIEQSLISLENKIPELTPIPVFPKSNLDYKTDFEKLMAEINQKLSKYELNSRKSAENRAKMDGIKRNFKDNAKLQELVKKLEEKHAGNLNEGDIKEKLFEFTESKRSLDELSAELKTLKSKISQQEESNFQEVMKENANIKEKLELQEKLKLHDEILTKMQNNQRMTSEKSQHSHHSQIHPEHQSSDSIRKSILMELSKYDSDKTASRDWALASQGGRIVSSSDPYKGNSGLVSMLGLPLYYKYKPNSEVISPDVNPGSCFAFAGSKGYVVIQLAKPVKITGVTIEHVSKSLVGGAFKSSPRYFSLLALSGPYKGKLLAGPRASKDSIFEFNPNNIIQQEFVGTLDYYTISSENSFMTDQVEFQVHDNWGEADYTCIYRVRVHGE